MHLLMQIGISLTTLILTLPYRHGMKHSEFRHTLLGTLLFLLFHVQFFSGKLDVEGVFFHNFCLLSDYTLRILMRASSW